ncbi:hypothetical protein WA158_006207 [Blastocystis sp. Blastoise]
MSGGVDSSVSALLLKNQGYEVEGWYMKNWDQEDETGVAVCPEKEEYKDVEKVCKQLGIQCKKIPFEREYWNNVFTPCLNEYSQGLTPNPDVYCNREIKFKVFSELALQNADYVATGHYCRLSRDSIIGQTKEIGQFPRLLKGLDSTKDQSYFLCEVPGHSFERVLFPVGSLPKKTVRQIAAENNLITAEKRDSFGICFIGERNMNSFLSNYVTMKPGDIYSYKGDYMGKHNGLYNYTIGQCIKQSGLKTNDKDMQRNRLIVSPSQHSSLYTYSLNILKSSFHWIDEKEPSDLIRYKSMNCDAVTRYRQNCISCILSYDEQSPNEYKVLFKSPVRAVTPGQICVLYYGDVCLGGGSIYKHGKSLYEEGIDIFINQKEISRN